MASEEEMTALKLYVYNIREDLYDSLRARLKKDLQRDVHEELHKTIAAHLKKGAASYLKKTVPVLVTRMLVDMLGTDLKRKGKGK